MLQGEISRKRGELIENSCLPLENSKYPMGFGNFDRYLNERDFKPVRDCTI